MPSSDRLEQKKPDSKTLNKTLIPAQSAETSWYYKPEHLLLED